jgi:uncharacterized protein YutE (UPF0331/DUF86 family)
MRIRHPRLFDTARVLKGQRNILTHRYGLPDPSIDWSKVWETLAVHLEEHLLRDLNEAILKEEMEDDDED